MLALGSDCLFTRDGCPFYRGAILSCDGLTSVYVGVLFLGLTFGRSSRSVWLVVLLDTFVVAAFITGIGLGCVLKRPSLVPAVCESGKDGIPIIILGSVLGVFALIPTITLMLQRCLPRAPQRGPAGTLFWIGSAFGMLAAIATVAGRLCEENALGAIDIKQCPRTENINAARHPDDWTYGLWSVAMKLYVWGALLLVLFCLTLVFSFAQRRVDAVWDFCTNTPVFVLGLLLLLWAVVWTAVGALCLSDNLYGVANCTEEYDSAAMLTSGLSGLFSALLLMCVGWCRRTTMAEEMLISLLWLLAAILGVAGGIGAAIGAACWFQTELWLRGDCRDSWGAVLLPVSRNVLMLSLAVLGTNVGLHRRAAFHVTSPMRRFCVLIKRNGMCWYMLAVSIGAVSFSAGVPCLAGALVVSPDCPEGMGALLTAAGSLVFCLSLAVWCLRAMDARGREKLTQRAACNKAEWQRYTPNEACLVGERRNGLTIWPTPQKGAGAHVGKLQRGDSVKGCLVGGWLRIEFPANSGEAGWVTAVEGGDRFVLPCADRNQSYKDATDENAENSSDKGSQRPPMSKEEAVRRQVAENARLRVQAEALETKLAKIRTEIRDDDTAADHKELVRFEAATAAVREAAPVAARQNASASARLNAARQACATALRAAADARKTQSWLSRDLEQRIRASNGLREQAKLLSEREQTAEAVLAELCAGSSRAAATACSDADTAFYTLALGRGWLDAADNGNVAELMAQFQTVLALHRERARLVSAVSDEQSRQEDAQERVSFGKQLMMNHGDLRAHAAALTAALRNARALGAAWPTDHSDSSDDAG